MTRPIAVLRSRTPTAGFALILLCLLFLGCAPGRALRDDEMRITAWYIEDLARGTPRQAGEIQLVEPSTAMGQVARLLTGSVIRDRVEPPPQLAERIRRWPALRGMFGSGMAVLVGTGPERGLVAPKRGLADSDLAMVTPLIDAENRDRRTLDALVIATAELNGSAVERYLSAIIAARLELDRAAGADVWSPSVRR